MQLSLQAIARAVGCDEPERGRDTLVTGVTTDSRTVREGSLFVCVAGEHVDGHDFAQKAAKAGAAAILASRPLPDVAAECPGTAVFVVPDTVRGLGAVACAWRKTYRGTVVGVTGTAGKTTVKEALAAVLAQAGTVAKTEMNHNNQIGMPLAMLAATGEETFWVMEAGISHAGDMDELGAIMQPDAALVLNVGIGHTEGLGGKGVAWNKCRLFAHMRPCGMAFASADYPDLVKEARLAAPGVRFFSAASGDAAPAACTARTIGTDAAGDIYEVTFGEVQFGDTGETLVLRPPLRGPSGAEDCAAVALVAKALGLDCDQIARGMASITLPGQRFRRLDVGAFRLIDDSYNANPLSMQRALLATAEEAAAHEGAPARPVIAVLGMMGELGDFACAAHEKVGEEVATLNPAVLFWKGEFLDEVKEGLARTGWQGQVIEIGSESDFRTALEALVPERRFAYGAVFLFKGSRVNELERCVAVAEEFLGLKQEKSGESR